MHDRQNGKVSEAGQEGEHFGTELFSNLAIDAQRADHPPLVPQGNADEGFGAAVQLGEVVQHGPFHEDRTAFHEAAGGDALRRLRAQLGDFPVEPRKRSHAHGAAARIKELYRTSPHTRHFDRGLGHGVQHFLELQRAACLANDYGDGLELRGKDFKPSSSGKLSGQGEPRGRKPGQNRPGRTETPAGSARRGRQATVRARHPARGGRRAIHNLRGWARRKASSLMTPQS